MLSIVETIDPREELRQADQAAAAPYITPVALPWWQGILFSLAGPLFALIVILNAHSDSQINMLAPIPAAGMLLLALCMFLVQRKNRGVIASGGKAPAELRPLFLWRIVGAIVFIAVVSALAFFTPWFVSLPISYLLAYAGLIWLARAHERAAAKARARLA